MKRRQALLGIVLAGGAVGTGYSLFRWRRLTAAPKLNTLEQAKELIGHLAETIIPKTDTPGAMEAGVGEFIVTMVKDCTDRKTQNKFISGLQEIENHCVDQFDQFFIDCDIDQRVEVLKYFEKSASLNGILGKARNKYLGKPFFVTLKEYTIEGYFTSQLGATQSLNYVPIPARYEPCLPLEQGQVSWATNLL